jgi:hypothetical protein
VIQGGLSIDETLGEGGDKVECDGAQRPGLSHFPEDVMIDSAIKAQGRYIVRCDPPQPRRSHRLGVEGRLVELFSHRPRAAADARPPAEDILSAYALGGNLDREAVPLGDFDGA